MALISFDTRCSKIWKDKHGNEIPTREVVFYPPEGGIAYVQVPDPFDSDSNHYLFHLGALRTMYDFTRKQLFNATGICEQYLWELEKLHHMARPETSTDIAKALGFHFFPEWLWMPINDNPAIESIQKYQNVVPPEGGFVLTDSSIREQRLTHKVSVKILAKFANVSHSTIIRVERGGRIREQQLALIKIALEDHLWRDETPQEHSDRMTREWQR